MNISTPLDDKIENELVIDDGEIIRKSLIVAEKLDVYLDDLKVLAKNNFSTSKEDNRYQSKLHGLAWIATYVEALKQMSIWADQLYRSESFKKAERTILMLSFNEYLNQLFVATLIFFFVQTGACFQKFFSAKTFSIPCLIFIFGFQFNLFFILLISA